LLIIASAEVVSKDGRYSRGRIPNNITAGGTQSAARSPDEGDCDVSDRKAQYWPLIIKHFTIYEE
jgi:hypothetical protein